MGATVRYTLNMKKISWGGRLLVVYFSILVLIFLTYFLYLAPLKNDLFVAFQWMIYPFVYEPYLSAYLLISPAYWVLSFVETHRSIYNFVCPLEVGPPCIYWRLVIWDGIAILIQAAILYIIANLLQKFFKKIRGVR